MTSVTVLVRARPLNSGEISSEAKIILKMDKYKTYISALDSKEEDKLKLKRRSKSEQQFFFERSYWSVNRNDENFADQKLIYDEYGSKIVESALSGYNACLFAYGQTGSGKTYTMMGNVNNKGIIPRICDDLFTNLNEAIFEKATFRVEISYMEIYNEQVRDLLERKNKKVSMKSLKLREHPRDGPFVQGLTVHPVTDYSSIESLLEEGNNIRATAATNMNSVSSRSHAIFTIKLSQAKLNDNIPSETTSKVNLVDLAGSERAASSGATGLRLKEGANINKSLVTLSLVISALAENSGPFKEFPRRQVFVPYRDSVLTWLLKDSLGGNSRTIMIAAVSPADSSYNETLSTLKYASHARKIINRPVINEDPNVKLIRELRAEISELQNLLSSYRKNNKDNCKEEDVMQARLHENQERVENLTRNWIDKNMEAQRIFQEKSVHLHCQGQQTVLTTAKVHLINMEDDPLNTDIIIYHLNEGETLVGNCDVIESNCINLKCPSIEKNHCSIFVSSNKVSIVPVAFHTYVNDKQITTEHFLRHGDILQIGEIFRFRFSNPSEAEQLRVNRKSGLFSLDVSPLVLDHYRSFSNLEEIDAVCPGNDNTEIKMLSSTKQSYIQNKSFESQQVENDLSNYVILREKSQQQVQNYKHHRFSFPEKSQVNIANLKLSEKCHSTEILSSSPIMDYQNDSKFTIKNSKLNCTSISTLNLNGNYFLESNDSSIPSVRSDVNLRKVKSLPFLDVYEKPSNNLYMNNRENSEAKSEEEKRKLLQDLISKFRKKEIERVESSAENIRRAESNGKLFVQQYGNLEELLTLQKEQLQNAKSELVNFKKKVLEEKYLLRIGAEHEMSNKLLSCITIENDQIRRKKFLLKLEIEDYWKKMDLYQDLLIEVELDQYSLFRETEGMIAKKCRKYSEERHQQAEELRKNVSNSESRIADLKKDLDDQHLNEQDLTLKLEEIKTKYQTKIFESDEYFWKLRCSQEKELENLKNDLYVLNDRIEYFEKLGVDVCSNKTHVPINSKQISVNMSASDYSELLHTNNIEELKNIRNVVQMHIDETNQKIQNLIQDCRYTSLQLQDEMQSKIERYETSLSKKQEQILKLQRQLSNEQLNCQNFHNNLHLFQHKSLIDQTLETYGSNISCLSESQEQLKDSNAQVKESLEKRLRDEFSTLEELIISSTHKSNQKGIFDKTLQLIFQSGNPFTYTEIISKKHLLYENTKHLLLVTCEDLHLLTQEHLKLHHEFTKDFFLRKSSLEDIQNNEREEIRDFIKWLALDENDAYIHAYKSEENQIMKFQSTLNRLETEMYEKMVEKQNSYLKIEALEEHIRQVNFSSLPFCSQVFVETVDEDLERARLDMSECEFLIQKLQVEIMQEQKSYLAMLRKKEDEMKTIEIGNRLRRCQLFQNQANQAAADVLREVHLCSTIIDCVEKNGENYHSVGGWKYKGKHNGTTLLRKNGDKPGYLCAMVCSLIKVQPRLVWEAIRNPLFRLVYDDMVKKINIVEHCNEHLKIIYLRQKLTFLFISQTLLDCCCVHTERVERNQYVAASVSVDHPDCPITKNVHRLNVGPSGWVVKLFIDENGEEWSMVWYLVNVQYGNRITQYVLNNLYQKVPSSITALRNYLVN